MNKDILKPKIVKDHGYYFPNKPIWLVFDLSNGQAPGHRYVWWFNTKKQAIQWSEDHIKDNIKFGYDISIPTRWYPNRLRIRKI